MEKLRLKQIIPVRFNRSEARNFKELYRSRTYRPVLKSLKPGECVCFISKDQGCLSFVQGFVQARQGKKKWVVFASRKHRIEKERGYQHRFEPLMLANYARHLGIELVGIKLFEEHFKHLL